MLANNAEGTFSAIIERRQRVLAMQSAFGHWVIRRRRPRHHRRNRRGADDYRRGVGAQPAAAATALSGKIASAKVTDVPKLSRKTAMVTLRPQKDTTDTSGTTKKAVDEPSSSQKGDTSATADKPNHPRLKLPKKDADNSGASSKHEPKKADKQSVSAGAKQK